MFGIDDIIGSVVQVVNKFIPDPQEQAKLQLELTKLKQAEDFKQIDAALQIAQNQTDIDKVEAASSNLLRTGWRPTCGWVCAIAFGYHYVVLPQFNMGTLMTLLAGMLGLGGMRSFDKVKGASK